MKIMNLPSSSNLTILLTPDQPYYQPGFCVREEFKSRSFCGIGHK